MFYEGDIYRPPSESASLILQLTVGCSHNACSFCGMYKQKKFRIKTREEIMKIIEEGYRYQPTAERIFLADGDALGIETDLLVEILNKLYQRYPNLKRVGIYGRPQNILNKTDKEMLTLKENGLGIVYLGVESGSPKILKQINKGVSVEEVIAAGKKVVASSLLLSCTVILGLGGRENSEEHARETGKIISAIDPQYLGALTLMIHPPAPLAHEVAKGNFKLPNQWEILKELEIMISNLDVSNCVFRSNHASNYLALKGTLPKDKEMLLSTLRDIIEKNKEEFLRPEIWRGL